MKKLLKGLLGLSALLTLLLVGMYAFSSSKASRALSRTVATHVVGFPVPYPLSGPELVQAGLQVDADGSAVDPDAARALARERALERGRHLIASRYACTECHGDDFGGGVMIDDPAMGRLLGPNLTTGRGSRTLDYGAGDWDRAVRHGVLPDSTPSMMPAEEFQLMSDQELSDIVVYIRSLPPVDNPVPPVDVGPLAKVLLATGRLRLAADMIEAHDEPHAARPPSAEPTLEFGRHLAGVCTGCHRADLSGGTIVNGPPTWPPARNLTPHADGLAGWTFEQFETALREGKRPDGTDLLLPMTIALPFTRNMTDVEMRALWTYLQSVPPVPTP